MRLLGFTNPEPLLEMDFKNYWNAKDRAAEVGKSYRLNQILKNYSVMKVWNKHTVFIILSFKYSRNFTVCYTEENHIKYEVNLIPYFYSIQYDGKIIHLQIATMNYQK